MKLISQRSGATALVATFLTLACHGPVAWAQPPIVINPPPLPPPTPGGPIFMPRRAEEYRIDLEKFRYANEMHRSAKSIDGETYRKNMDAYNEGIGKYREAIKKGSKMP